MSEPINDDMPMIVPLRGLTMDDLPDYYVEVTMLKREGYEPGGTPRKRNRRYAVRPLTMHEFELLCEAHPEAIERGFRDE